jgi:hypothetical protein
MTTVNTQYLFKELESFYIWDKMFQNARINFIRLIVSVIEDIETAKDPRINNDLYQEVYNKAKEILENDNN